MDFTFVVALASLVSALGAVVAALVAAFSLRAQQRMQSRQHNLENFWRIAEDWEKLGSERALAARSLLAGGPSDTHVRRVLNHLELTANLVRKGEIELSAAEALLGYSAVAWWHEAQSYIQHARVELGDALYEDLEWLQQRMSTPKGDWMRAMIARQVNDEPPAIAVTVVNLRDAPAQH